MPVKKLRFAQEETGRTAAPATPMATKDWEFLNLTPEVVVNPLTQGAEVWATTFTGIATRSTTTAGTLLKRSMVWSGYPGNVTAGDDMIITTGSDASDDCPVHFNATLVGTITSAAGGAIVYCTGMSETMLNGDPIVVLIIRDSTLAFPDVYFFTYLSMTQSLTFTGNTNTNTVVDNIASTSGMAPGQTITGTDIPANTRIASVTSGTAITITNAATGTTVGVTFTRSAIGKLIDADLPAIQTSRTVGIVGNMIHIDGYALVACTDGTLWASDLNSLTAWSATSFGSSDSKPDRPVGLASLNNTAVVFGNNSVDFFQNAGLATGSPFQKIPNMLMDIGAYGGNSVFGSSQGIFYDHTLSLIMQVDGPIYFIGNTSNQGSGELGIYRMDRVGSAKKISYGAIDKLLNEAVRGGSIIGFAGAGVMNGQKFVALTIASLRYFFYPASGLWWRQNIFASSMSGSKGTTYFTNGTDNILYRTDLTVRATGTTTIRCGMDDYGSEGRKFVPKITVIGDRKATSAASTVKLYADDYSTTVSSLSCDLSLVRPFVTRCGSGYNLAPEFSDADTQHVRIRGFDVEYTVGT